ncbi:uncharacterized protein LOC118478717 [Aplysia californica]|uniref:Uncharacterized protein LOC118478717 n=1 Tax=Aplysia californica TaxID=6500 RepID=A0ABM1W244_APLCA|nr:uncharacterized protein LOC118478717 [Aplysia californica]
MSKHSKSKLRKIFSIVSNFSFVDNKTKSQNSSPGSETKASRRSGSGGGTKNDDVYDKKRDTSSRNGSIVNANNGDVKACHRGECSTSCVENENRPRKGSKPSTNSGSKAARISPTKSEVCSKTSFTSKRPSNDLACPSCDVIHCKHEVGFHCVVPDNDDVIADRSRRRTSSMDSSVVTSPDEAGDQDLFPRWQSFRLEGPRCSEEVELTEEQKAVSVE